jgi:iron complex transport system ATP-binding protein
MVVHDLNHAAMFAGRVALLVDGEKRAEGPAADVLTEEILSAGFGLAVTVTSHAAGGKPVILPAFPAR